MSNRNTVCDALKKQFYECVSKNNLDVDPLLFRQRVGNLKNFQQNTISPDTFKKCPITDLSACLHEKYDVELINDKNLYTYFEEKYQNIEKSKISSQIKQNEIKTNKN